MYTNGGYLKNNPDWGAEDALQKAVWIKKMITQNNLVFEEVVEIGTGTGALLNELSNEIPAIKHLHGYDIAPDAIELAKKKENKRLSFYHSDFLKTGKNTDCLLIIDVLEHVQDYYCFLEELKKRATHFIFHIPLDLSCRTLLKPHVMLQQRQSVGHIHYFSKEMVWWMLQDTGYEITDWFYTKPIIDIQQQLSLKNKTKKTLRNSFFAINPSLCATLFGGYSLMILAK